MIVIAEGVDSLTRSLKREKVENLAVVLGGCCARLQRG
jgi:hypothetical protein